MLSLRRLIIALSIFLLNASQVQASPFEMHGLGAVGSASAGALTTSASDYHSVFYNPAQLLAKKRVHMGLGTAFVAPSLSIEQSQSESIYPAVLPKSNLGVHLGVSGPVAGVFEKKLALGVGLYLPLMQHSRVEALDPHTPQAYMHQSLPDRIVLALGMAYEIVPSLYFGIGFQTLASLDGTADASLSMVQKRVTRRTLRVDFFGEIAPIAGLTWRPMDSLRLGIAYRGAIGFSYDLPVRLEIEEVGVMQFQAEGVSLWAPDIIDFGLSWSISSLNLTLSATLSWAFWSDAPAPNNIMTVIVDDRHLSDSEAVETDALLWVKSYPMDLGASDVFIPRFSALWNAKPYWHIRSGYAYRPTPIPRAVHAATYLDANTHILGLGTGFTIGDPTEVQDEPVTFEIAVQWQKLEPRSAIKKDPENPTGNVQLRGSVMVFQLEIHHDF